MANILFVPVPEFGHMIPPLKLARALKQRGHQVYYVGFSDFEDYVRAQGLEFIPIFEQRYPKGYLNARTGKQAKMKLDRLSMMFLEAKEAGDSFALNPIGELEKEIARVFQIVEPDLFIVDNMLRDLAFVSAQNLGAPTIILSLHFEEARIGLGGPGFVPPDVTLPVIVLCPREIDFGCTQRKSNYYYLEASIETERKETQAFPWHELDESKPLIYCSFGSQCHQYEQSEGLFRTIIEAMKQRPDWQLVLAVGPYLNTSDFYPLPENVVVVNWAPQLEMLERASMMINHGGLGAVKECIFFGVPMIVFPGKWDQPNHAARVVYHGLGVRGSINNPSAEQVNSLIDTIDNDPMFKSRIDAMSRTFREIEESGIGVRTVEKLLADYQLKRSLNRNLVVSEVGRAFF